VTTIKPPTNTATTGGYWTLTECRDDNALGRLKINFPNPYSIYMHDTPQKQYFKRDFRAFSHGCIRLHEPLSLGKMLLERHGSLDEEQFQQVLDELKERTIALDAPVPIYVEYNVTTVDEKGRAHFLADVYRYDKAYFEGELTVVNLFELDAWKKGKKKPFKGVVQVRTP